MADFKIPYGRQHITEDDIEAVVTTLKSDFLTQGPRIAEFEEAFADYVGSQYAVAVSNGTAALHLCAMALDVKPGQKVITSPITFAASANCIRFCGGEVVFGDIDPETWLLSESSVRKLLESAPRGTYSGIVPVDFTGRPAPMDRFRDLADEYGLWIIEDACHAPGGSFSDANRQTHRCGDGSLANLAIFSFHPVKHIAAGEGGMVTTNDPQLYDRIKTLRTHGIVKGDEHYKNDIALAGGSTTYPGWYMEMQELGYNYRITDFQAALGHSQLRRAHEGLERRRAIAKRYTQELSGVPGILRTGGVVEGHAYHLYVLEVEDREGLYEALRSANIFAQIHYIPLHLMPYYRELGHEPGDCPVAEAYYRQCISIPMYPTLSSEEQDFVIERIKSFYA